MKTYKITISGKEIEVTQNEDGSFNKPDIVKELEPIGTALKPAFEPICMAMKPLSEKNYVANCLKYGTGGINIDESRVAHQSEADRLSATPQGKVIRNNFAPGEGVEGTETNRPDTSLGRFPANLLHDNSEEVRECFPETKSHGGGKATYGGSFGNGKAVTDTTAMERFAGDSGNASRFFKSIIYQAKASKSERNKGCEGLEEKVRIRQGLAGEHKDTVSSNSHPTVKPIALMEYLIKMVTPKGGIVLDPFAGSGSTLIAAKQNGFNYIGIEMEADYIKIAEARLQAVPNKLF